MSEERSSCARSADFAAYISGDLPESIAGELELHIQQCADCRQSLAHALQSGSGDQVGELLNLVSGSEPDSAAVDAEVSDTSEMFSRYRLMRVLGRGGTAIVWEAWDCVMKRSVAVKHLLAEKSAWQESRFLREASVLARLSHPNIVSVYELAHHHGRLAIVMEHVPGVNLAKFLQGSPVAEREAILMLKALCAAVSHAHGQGIIHRDLKPSNVLLSWSDQPPSATRKLSNATIKITDFGLARVIDASQQTEVGQRMGTPGYMSPEQVAGDLGATGERTDVYGLGAILYELLVGRPPFVADDPLVTMSLIRERAPVAPRLLLPAISGDLEAICLKCLAKLPSERYGSAVELQADLEAVQAGRPALAVMRTGWRRSSMWLRSNRLFAVSVLATLLTTIGLIWQLQQNSVLSKKLLQQTLLAENAAVQLQDSQQQLRQELLQSMENWDRALSFLENIGMMAITDKYSAERRQFLGGAALKAFRAYFERADSNSEYQESELPAAMRFVDLLHTYAPEYSTTPELQKIAASIDRLRLTGVAAQRVRELSIQRLYLQSRNLWEQQNIGGSAECFLQAAELAQQSIAEMDADHPQRDTFVTNRASMLLDAANLHARMQKPAEAISLMSTACEIHKQRLAEQPDSEERRIAVIRQQCAMATLLRNLQDFESAARHAQETLLLSRQFTQTNSQLQPAMSTMQAELQAIIDSSK